MQLAMLMRCFQRVPRSRYQQAPYPSDASSHTRDIVLRMVQTDIMPVMSWHSEDGPLVIVMLSDYPWQVYGGPHVDGELMRRSRDIISQQLIINGLA